VERLEIFGKKFTKSSKWLGKPEKPPVRGKMKPPLKKLKRNLWNILKVYLFLVLPSLLSPPSKN